MLMIMNDEKIATWRYTTYSAAGETVLNQVDVDADVADALDRGDEVLTFRAHDHRRFEGEEARERLEAWYNEIQRGGG
jgi:hypothetical protein